MSLSMSWLCEKNLPPLIGIQDLFAQNLAPPNTSMINLRCDEKGFFVIGQEIADSQKKTEAQLSNTKHNLTWNMKKWACIHTAGKKREVGKGEQVGGPLR